MIQLSMGSRHYPYLSGTNHTGDYVELASFGPGSEMIDGLVINLELFNFILKATQIEVTA
jgi:alkaline phosphatase